MLTATLEGRTIALRGDTWGARDAIKAAGARWHAGTRTWRLPATLDAVVAARALGATLLDCGELLGEVFGQLEWPADIHPMNDPSKPPWSHQLRAFDFAATRSGTVLRLKMRMGKTLVSLALAIAWQAKLVLVVCPTRVVEVWRDEAEEHVPGRFRAVLLEQKLSVAKKAERLRHAVAAAAITGDALMVVVNYQSVWRGALAKAILKIQWDLVIADEAHRLKSAVSAVSRFMARVPTLRKLGPTGTFLPNGAGDAYAQMRFVAPAVFGTSAVVYNLRYKALVYPVRVRDDDNGFLAVKAHFHRMDEVKALRDARWHKPSGRWLVPDEPGNRASLEAMGVPGSQIHDEQLADFTARLARAVISIDYDEADVALPEQLDVPVFVDLSPPARAAYEQMREHLFAELQQGEIVAANALVKSLRLSQIASGTVDTDDGQRVQVCDAKVRAIEELCGDWFDEDRQPMVVFCRFRADLSRVEALAGKLGLEYGEISGTRKDGVDGRFLTPGKELVGVQVQSGGTGLDFCASPLGVFMTLAWSAADYEQARYRFLGSRQRSAVTFPHIVARGTVDEEIWQALRDKIDVSEAIMRHIRDVKPP